MSKERHVTLFTLLVAAALTTNCTAEDQKLPSVSRSHLTHSQDSLVRVETQVNRCPNQHLPSSWGASERVHFAKRESFANRERK